MRLICPSCGAEYEVDDSLIPAAGRDVECAACGHGWHQPGPQTPMVLGEEHAVAAVASPVPPGPDELPPTPRTSAAALAILREEAQRELSARATERTAAASGPDAAAAQVAAATLRENGADRAAGTGPAADPGATAPALPDPARMAASLDWPNPLPEAAAQPAPARRRYDQGFGLAVLAALALIAAYVVAPSLGDEGRVGAALADYRAGADRARLWLHDQVAPPTDRAIAAIRGLFAE